MLIKKIKMLALSTILVTGTLGLVGCSSKENNNVEKEDTFKVTLVLDEGGVNDQSFNESAYNGAKEAQEEYGNIEVSYLESKSESEYMSNIETAIDNDSDLVVGVGFKLVDTIEESAKNHPEQKFAIIDGRFENEIPANVVPILFNEEQSGYSAGLIASKMTKTNKVGFIGGMDIPSVTNFAIGFEKALKEVNPEITISRQYANSFTDSAKGKAIANQMISQGVDIIFTAGGGVNSGVFESSVENNIMAIGVDMPCNYIAPNNVITSALKNVGYGLKMVIKDAIDGNFTGGQVKMFDLSNGGVGYELTDLIPQDVIEFVDNKIKEIK